MYANEQQLKYYTNDIRLSQLLHQEFRQHKITLPRQIRPA